MNLSNFRKATVVIAGPKPMPDKTKPPEPPSKPVPGHKGRGWGLLSPAARFLGLPARRRKKSAASSEVNLGAQNLAGGTRIPLALRHLTERIDPAQQAAPARRAEPVLPKPVAAQSLDDQDVSDMNKDSPARAARQREKERVKAIVEHARAIGLFAAGVSLAVNSDMPRGQAIKLLTSLLAADPPRSSHASDMNAVVRIALKNASASLHP